MRTVSLVKSIATLLAVFATTSIAQDEGPRRSPATRPTPSSKPAAAGDSKDSAAKSDTLASAVAIAEGMLHIDDPEAAARHFRRAIDLHPATWTARAIEAQLLMRRRNFEGAAAMFESLSSSNHLVHRVSAAQAYAAAGNWEAAERLFDEYQAVCAGGNVFAFVPNEPTSADPALAIVHWKAAVERDPKSAIPRWLLGMALESAGRYTDAFATLESARQLSPRWAPILVAQAVTRLEAGSPDDAVKITDQVLVDRPDHVAARYVRLLANSKRRDYSEAAADGRRLVASPAAAADPVAIRLAAGAAFASGIDADAGALLDRANLHLPLGVTGTTCPITLIGATAKDDLQLLTSSEPYSTRRGKSGVWQYHFASAMALRATEVLRDLPKLAISSVYAGPTEKALAAELDQFESVAATKTADSIPFFDSGPVRPKIVSHLKQCVERLKALIAESPKFLSPRLTLALTLDALAAETKDQSLRRQSTDLLVELLRAEPNASVVRLMLCERVEIDQLQDLLKATPRALESEAANQVLLVANAKLLLAVGRDEECVTLCVGALHRCDDYGLGFVPMFCGFLGRALANRGNFEQALPPLELAAASAPSCEGVLALARVRAKLEKPDVVETLIDAWRIAPAASAEDRESRDMLKKFSALDRYLCRKCGGSGRVSEVGEGVRVHTRDVDCRQCLGLGLWHPKVR